MTVRLWTALEAFSFLPPGGRGKMTRAAMTRAAPAKKMTVMILKIDFVT
jgi:hypothetical protein